MLSDSSQDMNISLQGKLTFMRFDVRRVFNKPLKLELWTFESSLEFSFLLSSIVFLV